VFFLKYNSELVEYIVGARSGPENMKSHDRVDSCSIPGDEEASVIPRLKAFQDITSVRDKSWAAYRQEILLNLSAYCVTVYCHSLFGSCSLCVMQAD
jgi:hypothetical protein